MGDFSISPRAPKRRKTSGYSANRSILDQDDGESTVKSTPTNRSRTLRKLIDKENVRHDAVSDSVYDSRDFLEDGLPLSTEEDVRTEDATYREKQTAASMPSERTPQNSRTRERHPRSRSSQSETITILDEDDKPADMAVHMNQDTKPVTTTEVVVQDEDDLSRPVAQPRSSGRQRKPTRRYSISPEKPRSHKRGNIDTTGSGASRLRREQVPQSAPPRGILTPSKKGGTRDVRRKSVVFDQSEKDIEEHFGFRDIGHNTIPSAKPSHQPTKKPVSTKRSPDKKEETVPDREQVKLGMVSELGDVDDDGISIEQLLESTVSRQDTDVEMTTPDVFSVIDPDPLLLEVKSIILSRLICSSAVRPSDLPIPFHLQTQYQTLLSLLTATIVEGESNSLLVLGSRGAGKSHLIRHALSTLSSRYFNDFHIVRLNGNYQTDDKLALKEIWKQLGRERELDEEETEGTASSSYADTMASLLTLLSHPEEFGTTNDSPDEGEAGDAGRQDRGRMKTSKSIIFILDEFDLFTNHPRQTLLYNLFDIAQSRKAPIAVVGCSTRMDVVECLEKRVKSRFSHRWIHVPTVKNLDALGDVLKTALCFSEFANDPQLTRGQIEIREKWNDYIESSFLVSTTIQQQIRETFYTTKTISNLLVALYTPVATVHPSCLRPGPQNMPDNVNNSVAPLMQQSPLVLLTSLSTLHLSMLIAAARLDTIHNLAAINFNLVYNQYTELLARSKLQQTASGAVAVGAGLKSWRRETARGAWEDLCGLALLVPVSSVGFGARDDASGMTGGEGAAVRMWRSDVTLDDLGWAVKEKWTDGGSALDVLGKWCREV